MWIKNHWGKALTLFTVLGLSSALRFIRTQRKDYWSRVSGEMAALQLEVQALEAAVSLQDPLLSTHLLSLLNSGKKIDHLEPHFYGTLIDLDS
jgi:hypothetical protein